MFKLKIGNRFLPGEWQSFNNSEAMAVKLKFEIWFNKLSLTKNVRASSSPCNWGFKNDNKDVEKERQITKKIIVTLLMFKIIFLFLIKFIFITFFKH